MELNFKEIVTATMVLFAVIDIVGSIPIIIDLRQKVGHIQSEKASIVAMLIMILFLFLGVQILNLIGIDVYSFAVAGSFVIFFLAIEMILGIQLYKEDSPKTASVVPLAFPLIAGAGTMTTILSLKAEFHTVNIIIAILACDHIIAPAAPEQVVARFSAASGVRQRIAVTDNCVVVATTMQ